MAEHTKQTKAPVDPGPGHPVTQTDVVEHPDALRRQTLDVSNTQYQSGTGRTPVKATTHPDEIAEVERANGPVVVGPLAEGRPENRELASLSPVAETPETAQQPDDTKAPDRK